MKRTSCKRIASKFIPPSITGRSKQPYRSPDAKSFFGDAASPFQLDYVQELLNRERIQSDGIFHADAVGKLVQKAEAGQIVGTKDNMALVGILSTQLLIDQFIRNDRETTNTTDLAIAPAAT